LLVAPSAEFGSTSAASKFRTFSYTSNSNS
jgi:hypothetical protein